MPSMNSRTIAACQACGRMGLEHVIFLGYVPTGNDMVAVGSPLGERPSFPLELVRCPTCALAQVTCVVSAKILYPASYTYRSNSTRILRDNFAELQRQCSRHLGLKAGDFVIDIGANDGTLLSPFRDAGSRVLGIEPSDAAKDAVACGIASIQDYFTPQLARAVRTEYGPAKVVTATNVFAHIDDIHPAIEGIKELLDDNGVFISESHYLLGLLETLQYDSIYHDHLRYYHLGSLTALLGSHDLDVFRVERIPTHGGSIRVYAGRRGARAIDPSVAALRADETRAGLDDGRALGDFRTRVASSKRALNTLLHEIKSQGGRIYGIGAPSRASTLISYTGIDADTLDAVMEIPTSPKVNHYMPGTRIPVQEEARLFNDQPEYALLLSWHIGAELARNLRQKGYRGKFIVPLPAPKLLEVPNA
ncbi:MAG: class I SAM-dependent methyltransferase [Alphaproteobacteria bacterium]|nr:class I SAM-dependent methyltransferase [Alphaproteobacteria bacterium]